MDLKKFLDQTVREVKREVNKKVLKVPEIEQKVYEATSNEPWGPHGTLMGDIAQATRNFNEYQMIMAILWKRLNDTGKNWRHVYKSLTVLEFLVANGAERVIDELREHSYQVQTLVDFQFVEPTGKDQGINVRKKAQSLVSLLSDRDKIREVRSKAAANRDKYRGVSSTGAFSKSSSYSSTGGGYGDYDEDRYGGTSRSGARDDYRYGEKDSYRDDRYKDDRYRDDDRPARDAYGDRYRDDKDRDRYEDDRYGGRGGGDGYGNDKYGDDPKNEGSGSGYIRDRNRSFDEDERYPPRRGSGSGSGAKGDDSTQDDREPSGLAAAVARAHTSQSNMTQPSNNASQGAERKATTSVGGSYFASQPSISADEVDDFDPRGPGARAQEDDPFGSSASAPAPAPVSAPVKTTGGIGDLFADSGFETTFVSEPAPESKHGIQANGVQSEDLFGASAFTAEQASTSSFTSASTTPFAAAPPANDMVNGSFQAFPSASSNGSNYSGSSSFAGQSTQNSYLPPPPPAPAPSYSSTNSFQNPSGAFQGPDVLFASGSNTQAPFAQAPHPPVVGNPYSTGANSGGPFPQNATVLPKPQQKSFQTKSTIWSDTLTSGLVDLNISGPKTNPLAELGIDLKDSIFSAQEKRKEEKAQPTAGHMGKAMGSGTGLGLAGAGGIAPPPGPSMMGMGVGVGMTQQPSMGMGLGATPGYGAPPGMVSRYAAAPGMSANPGYGVPPSMGQGMAMNPGMGGYGAGMGMVQGGYGPGLGMGSYSNPNPQYSGYR